MSIKQPVTFFVICLSLMMSITCFAVEQADIDQALSAVSAYKRGQSRAPLWAVEQLIRECQDNAELKQHIARGLAGILESEATYDARLFACRQLWQLGPMVAAPALTKMLLDEKAADLACYAIALDASAEAGSLLREALPKAEGRARLAIVNLLGERREAQSVEALGALAKDGDPAIAEAAAAALGKIATPDAASLLAGLVNGADPPLEVLHAYLQCADGLAASGKTQEARAAYEALSEAERPGVIRKAAQFGLGHIENAAFTPLFDGNSFEGWEGNLEIFRIEAGAIVGGTLDARIPHNDFLCTTSEYDDFELRLQVKLAGEGANAGIQIRSRRVPDHHEVSGYQADMGQHYWGALYDESRRNKILVAPEKEALAAALKPDDWNDYVIRCDGKRIQLWINGFQTVDYTEPDDAIEQKGIIGLQIHGGGPSEAWYRNIRIRAIDGEGRAQ